MKKQDSRTRLIFGSLFVLLLAIAAGFAIFQQFVPSSRQTELSSSRPSSSSQISSSQPAAYEPSQEERSRLASRFSALKAVNAETVAYVYAPGTMLDEPVVQTGDNGTYLLKTFDGGEDPYMGTVFLDADNNKNFSDRLTWMFGHARGSKVPDHRMFNDVNFYDQQDYFDQHKYVVVETPERPFYYEAMGLVIVPEETAFYRTHFKDDQDFTSQLKKIYEEARTKSAGAEIRADDRYLVLSTCREEDDTIRANLYLRQIPDREMSDFLAQHGQDLGYVSTRSE